MTKSSSTMHRVARSYAASFGARIHQNNRCGIFLTIGELKDLYTSQHFNHRGTAMRRHVESWMAVDKAVVEGSLYDPSAAVWFSCPEDLRVLVMVRSQECGGRYVTEIDRTAWPVLRRMHGIQEELEASA